MWSNKQPQPSTLVPAPPAAPTAASAAPAPPAPRPAGPAVRPTACLGAGLTIKGAISGNEDLQIDGKVEGPISLGGHRLTVGRTAEITAEIVAREVIVYGKVHGDLRAHDRIEIKKNGSVTGDLNTARISIEDGAYFKGQIEIDRNSSPVGTDLDTLLARTSHKSQGRLEE